MEKLSFNKLGQWTLFKGEKNIDKGHSVFNMDHVKAVSGMKDLNEAKKLAHDAVDASNANPKNKISIKKMISDSRSIKNLAIGMSNHILAHPSVNLKVIKEEGLQKANDLPGWRSLVEAESRAEAAKNKSNSDSSSTKPVNLSPTKKPGRLKTVESSDTKPVNLSPTKKIGRLKAVESSDRQNKEEKIPGLLDLKMNGYSLHPVAKQEMKIGTLLTDDPEFKGKHYHVVGEDGTVQTHRARAFNDIYLHYLKNHPEQVKPFKDKQHPDPDVQFPAWAEKNLGIKLVEGSRSFHEHEPSDVPHYHIKHDYSNKIATGLPMSGKDISDSEFTKQGQKFTVVDENQNKSPLGSAKRHENLGAASPIQRPTEEEEEESFVPPPLSAQALEMQANREEKERIAEEQRKTREDQIEEARRLDLHHVYQEIKKGGKVKNKRITEKALPKEEAEALRAKLHNEYTLSTSSHSPFFIHPAVSIDPPQRSEEQTKRDIENHGITNGYLNQANRKTNESAHRLENQYWDKSPEERSKIDNEFNLKRPEEKIALFNHLDPKWNLSLKERERLKLEHDHNQTQALKDAQDKIISKSKARDKIISNRKAKEISKNPSGGSGEPEKKPEFVSPFKKETAEAADYKRPGYNIDSVKSALENDIRASEWPMKKKIDTIAAIRRKTDPQELLSYVWNIHNPEKVKR